MAGKKDRPKEKPEEEGRGPINESAQRPIVRPSMTLSGLARISKSVPRERVSGAPPLEPDLDLDLPPPSAPPSTPRVTPNERTPVGIVPGTVEEIRHKMHEHFAQDHFEAALELALLVVERDANNYEARECSAKCRERLVHFYLKQLGSLEQVPVLRVAPEKLREMALDSRVGFVLHLIDGVETLEEILDVTSMPLLDGLRLMCDLVERRLVLLT
jgi:hypothetical protein